MNYKHGSRHTREYRIWCHMKTRCFNHKSAAFKDYGGRGISVCPEWVLSFAAFMRDMGPCPDGHSIERKDNDKDYAPWNCVWADRVTQNRNRRGNLMLTADGETLPIHEWCRRNGLKPHTIRQRLVYGWTEQDAATLPVRR